MPPRTRWTFVITLWLCQVCLRNAETDPPEGGKINLRRTSRSQVMYVLECEGVPEWQAIPAEAAAVEWVRELKDRMTINAEHPDGEDLKVRII